MSPREIVVVALAGLGTVFILLSVVGLLRMPDLYMRIQATTKATTLGLLLVMAALSVHFAQPGETVKAVLVILFLFLTQPIAAHMIARAGYRTDVPLWEGSVTDELAAAESASRIEDPSGL